MAIKPSSKYYPLFKYLRQQDNDMIELSFKEIEGLLDQKLPNSARDKRSFWSNRQRGGYQASSWLEAGYQVIMVDLETQNVVFRKKKLRYEVNEESGNIAWDASSLRALREHLSLSQAEFAERLGVRQQTISEWETGQYEPSRGRSKHLRWVAERAEFPFDIKKQA